MKADDLHVAAVRDFLLTAVCLNCANTIRRDRADFDALLASVLTAGMGQPYYHHEVLTRRPDGTVHAMGTVRISCSPAMPNEEVVAALRAALADRAPEEPREERIVSTFACAALIVLGFFLGAGCHWLMGLAGGVR